MKVFEWLGKSKVYLIRAVSYLSIINFILIFGTFKQAYDINISLYILIPMGIIFALLIGYLDYRLILKHETQHNNRQNDVKTQLNRIEVLLEELKMTNCNCQSSIEQPETHFERCSTPLKNDYKSGHNKE